MLGQGNFSIYKLPNSPDYFISNLGDLLSKPLQSVIPNYSSIKQFHSDYFFANLFQLNSTLHQDSFFELSAKSKELAKLFRKEIAPVISQAFKKISLLKSQSGKEIQTKEIFEEFGQEFSEMENLTISEFTSMSKRSLLSNRLSQRVCQV